MDVWVRNWQYVARLYNYGSAVRKVMYTTNAIDSVNSSLRKVTKKGAFPNEDAVRKAFYLRIVELYKKRNGRPVTNWVLVRNQLAMDDKMQVEAAKSSYFLFAIGQDNHNINIESVKNLVSLESESF